MANNNLHISRGNRANLNLVSALPGNVELDSMWYIITMSGNLRIFLSNFS